MIVEGRDMGGRKECEIERGEGEMEKKKENQNMKVKGLNEGNEK